ncbi:MAG: hypothetical protein BWY69_00299 [Planctomycetes bacterium ADurb.Bin401]|nr:MAG: hypothetical protein BWY69_00299 [Planctomycetes bacterium ADurb.Bin401]
MENPESEIIDYLSEPKNLRTALEIGSRFDTIRKELYDRFWNGIEKRLLNKKPPLNLDSCKFTKYIDDPNWKTKFEWANLCMDVHPSTQKIFVRYSIAYSTQTPCDICFGIVWSEWQPLKSLVWKKPSVSALINYLSKKHYGQEYLEMWLGLEQLDEYDNEFDLLEKSVTDFDLIAENICNKFWPFVENTYELVKNANLELKRMR